jgi:tetratricopeptide (TPR) repeat protein
MNPICKALLVLSVLFSVPARSQDPVDSLKKVLANLPEDTNRVNTLNELGYTYFMTDEPLNAKPYILEALALAEKLNFDKGKMEALGYMGNVNQMSGDGARGLEYLFKALPLAEKLKNDNKKYIFLNTIGNCYKISRQYAKAIEYYSKALDMAIEKKHQVSQARCFYNIGASYSEQGDSAFKMKNETYAKSRYSKALEYHNKSLAISEKLDEKTGVYLNYNMLGNIYKASKEFDKANEFYNKSLKLAEELGDKSGVGITMFNLGEVITRRVSDANKAGRLTAYRKALPFFESSYRACIEIGDMNGRVESLVPLYSLMDSLGDRGRAFDYYKEYIQYRDSIYNKENTEKAVRAEMNFELEKKEAEAKLQQERSIAENRKQKLIIYFVIGILVLVMVFAVFVLRSNRQKRKANIEITKQKQIIEDKQRAILDSIRYAKRIQSAFLTSEKYISRAFEKLKS